MARGVAVARTVAIVRARQIAGARAVAVAIRTVIRAAVGIGGGRFDRGGAIAIAVPKAIATAVAVIGGRNHRVLTVGRIRREGARAGVGRALIDVIILRGGLGETLIGAIAVAVAVAGPVTAATGVAAGIDRRDRLARIEAAGRGGRGGSEHHGSRRDQSRNHLTHYSLLLIFVFWILSFLNPAACRVSLHAAAAEDAADSH